MDGKKREEKHCSWQPNTVAGSWCAVGAKGRQSSLGQEVRGLVRKEEEGEEEISNWNLEDDSGCPVEMGA